MFAFLAWGLVVADVHFTQLCPLSPNTPSYFKKSKATGNGGRQPPPYTFVPPTN